MTEEELANKFFEIFQNAFPGQVTSYRKVAKSNSTLRIELLDDTILHFTCFGNVWRLVGRTK